MKAFTKERVESKRLQLEIEIKRLTTAIESRRNWLKNAANAKQRTYGMIEAGVKRDENYKNILEQKLLTIKKQ